MGNKKKICRHPNFFQFVEMVIVELKNSSNAAAMVDGGKSSIAMRERLMSDLEQGKTSLILPIFRIMSRAVDTKLVSCIDNDIIN